MKKWVRITLRIVWILFLVVGIPYVIGAWNRVF